MLDANFFDAKIIKKTIKLLKQDNELFEIRIIQKSSKKAVISGYFTNADTLLKALETIQPKGSNVYITINQVNSACYSREQHDCLRQTSVTTQDKEIDSYQWLFIDFDPERLSEISSSYAELQAASALAKNVKNYLDGMGFAEPIIAMSGNGYHLLYRIDLPNNQESKELIEHCLINLANMFNTGTVKIDTVNYNPSRICKLYGTLAQKGANTKDRPHRMSKIIYAPKEMASTDKSMLEKLAGELPKQEPVKKQAKTAALFDLESWMQEHGLTWIEKAAGNGCDIYPLSECPFDHSHTNGDSKIFHYSDGAIAFKCHHNSCKGKKWQDVRELLEPGAYDQKETEEERDKRYEAGWQEHKKSMQYRMMVTVSDENEVKKNLQELKSISALELQSKKFDEKFYAVQNMIPEGETVLAAPPKTGKSWLMLDMCIKVARGDKFLSFDTTKCGTLYLALEDGDSFEQERLNKVLDGAAAPDNFHFVFSDVMPMQSGFLLQLDKLLQKLPDIKVVVIDTLNFIKYRQGKNANAYEVDYQTGRELKAFGEERHLAVVCVTHTTKMLHPEDNMADVSGTNGVTGAADSVIVLSKEKRMAKEAKIFITGRKVRQSMHDIRFNQEKCVWEYIGVSNTEEKAAQEQANKEQEYCNSKIRDVVIQLAYSDKAPWEGRAGLLVQEAIDMNIGLTEGAKEIGGFLCKMQGMFLSMDGIAVKIINNGTASRIYRIEKKEVLEIPFEVEE